MINNISYFEFKSYNDQYVSKYPSAKTTAGVMPKYTTEDTLNYVFPYISKDNNTILHFQENLQALSDNFFMFPDFYWFVDPKGAGATYSPSGNTFYNLKNILNWMSSLYYDDNYVVEANHIKCTMKSTLSPEFSLPCYITSTSLPQEAIDSIPVSKGPEGLRVILGRRAANPPVSVSNGDFHVEITGKPGYILYGEHLEPSEKKKIDVLYDKFLQSGKSIMEISSQDSSSALRALYEEGGLEISGKISAYMLKKDDAPGRDARYWTFGKNGKFGYKRVSSSYNILLIIPTLDKLPEPKDTIECQKGVIISETEARTEFRVGGKYDPVFPAHVRQLNMALDEADKL
jgi:hypothetical protein